MAPQTHDVMVHLGHGCFARLLCSTLAGPQTSHCFGYAMLQHYLIVHLQGTDASS